MSPRSENGGGESGGESSGNESPTPDREAVGTPDPRGRQTHTQLSSLVSWPSVSNKATSTCALL
jgi:hypothetical protein